MFSFFYSYHTFTLPRVDTQTYDRFKDLALTPKTKQSSIILSESNRVTTWLPSSSFSSFKHSMSHTSNTTHPPKMTRLAPNSDTTEPHLPTAAASGTNPILPPPKALHFILTNPFLLTTLPTCLVPENKFKMLLIASFSISGDLVSSCMSDL